MSKENTQLDMHTTINKILLIVVILGGISLMSMVFLRKKKDVAPDDLGKVKSISLDKKLAEISGLSYSDEFGLLAINDEKGKIFKLQKSNGKIKEEYSFSDSNDFEGITVVGKHIYVIDSSGDLYRFNTKTKKTKRIKTDLKHKNDIEGLCYNPVDSSLLIAAKGQSLPDKKKKSFSSIFKFDIEKGKLHKDVFLKIDIAEVKEALGKKIKNGFGTSGIAVKDGHILVVSHQNKAMLIYGPNHELKTTYNLDHKKYNQPEGITFINDILVISNEKGSSKNSTLAYHKNFSL